MPYTDPNTVESPKSRVEDVEVIFDKGPKEKSWSVARLKFDGNDAVGIRWNGDESTSGVGTPSAFANPTWFILPGELAETVARSAEQLLQNDEEALRAGYEAMAADEEHEAEAMEWIESHIGESM